MKSLIVMATFVASVSSHANTYCKDVQAHSGSYQCLESDVREDSSWFRGICDRTWGYCTDVRQEEAQETIQTGTYYGLSKRRK